MGTKSLKEKAIKIQGKQYVLVSDRIIYFNETYPNGCIKTEQLQANEPDRVEFKAVVIPDSKNPERFFTGHSQAVWGEGMVNKTSALENAETSAVGRALALMGIGVIDSIASVDEINKAKSTPNYDPSLVKPGHCNVCGETAVKAKSGNWYCPAYKAHKENGESWKIVADKKPLTPNEQKFMESL